MSEYEITYANDKHIGRINLVNIQADLHLFGKEFPSESLNLGFLRNRIADNSVIVALDENQDIAGFVAFEAKIRPHQYHINQISVAPDYLRQGIGSALLEEAVSDIRKLGGKKIGLTTLLAAPWSVELYKKAGFKQIEFSDLDNKLYEKIQNEVRHDKDLKGYFELAL